MSLLNSFLLSEEDEEMDDDVDIAVALLAHSPDLLREFYKKTNGEDS